MRVLSPKGWRGLLLAAFLTTSVAATTEIAGATTGSSAIVAWTPSDSIVVLSASTGMTVRTLATHVLLIAPGLPNLSVAPSGTVYFDSGSSGADQIYRVPITGGPVTLVTAGFDPQVSPNGTTLAFIAPEPGEQVPYLDQAGGVDIASTTSSGITDIHRLAPDPAQLNQGIFQLSWRSDSRALSFDLLNGHSDITSFWTISPTKDTESLAAARQVPIHNASLTWNGYGSQRIAGKYVGLGVLTSGSGAQQVVTVNPSTGRRQSTLFKVPGDICVPVGPTSPPMTQPHPGPCTFPFNNSVSGDLSGGSILVAGATRTIASTGGHTAASLYRWEAKTKTLKGLTSGVDVATWAPS
jgi:Tol biopolymer transport system component